MNHGISSNLHLGINKNIAWSMNFNLKRNKDTIAIATKGDNLMVGIWTEDGHIASYIKYLFVIGNLEWH